MPWEFQDIAFWNNLQQENQQELCWEEQMQTPTKGVDPSAESQSQAVSCPVDRQKGFAYKLPSGNAERDDVFFQ